MGGSASQVEPQRRNNWLRTNTAGFNTGQTMRSGRQAADNG